MPIKRNLAKQPDVWKTLTKMARDTARLLRQPLTSRGWTNYIARELGIDLENSSTLFEQLVTEGTLIFTRMKHNKSIYINDRTPEYKRYMWFSDTE